MNLREYEAEALNKVAALQHRLNKLDNSTLRRKAEIELLEAMEYLDTVTRAKGAAIPYRAKFVRCSACGNPFHNESSLLKHWSYNGRGRVACVSTPAILKSMGFVADEYRYPNEPYPEYVLRVQFAAP